MRAPTTLAATALTAAAALVLTACGGSGSSAKSATPIKGSHSSPASTSPSPTASAVKRPTITFPPGAKNVFEGQHTGDPKKDAVLADNAQSVNAVDDAIFLGNPKLPALSFYNTDDALADDGSYIQGYLDKDLTWVGTTRYFDRRATLNSDGTASVVYCSDESRSFLKNRKTGKVDNTPTTSDSYVLYNTRLKRTTQGVWQTASVVSQRGSKECQP